LCYLSYRKHKARHSRKHGRYCRGDHDESAHNITKIITPSCKGGTSSDNLAMTYGSPLLMPLCDSPPAARKLHMLLRGYTRLITKLRPPSSNIIHQKDKVHENFLQLPISDHTSSIYSNNKYSFRHSLRPVIHVASRLHEASATMCRSSNGFQIHPTPISHHDYKSFRHEHTTRDSHKTRNEVASRRTSNTWQPIPTFNDPVQYEHLNIASLNMLSITTPLAVLFNSMNGTLACNT
jgi:hypothetical protein